MKTCEHCRKEHTRKRFCSNRCKDKWHNTHNEVRRRRAVFFNRGIILMKGESLQDRINSNKDDDYVDYEGSGWDAHKDIF